MTSYIFIAGGIGLGLVRGHFGYRSEKPMLYGWGDGLHVTWVGGGGPCYMGGGRGSMLHGWGGGGGDPC